MVTDQCTLFYLFPLKPLAYLNLIDGIEAFVRVFSTSALVKRGTPTWDASEELASPSCGEKTI